MITKEYIFSGIVQGMGFRPTALRLATELGITGTVCNTGGRVTLIATGESAALTAFAKRLCRAFSIYQYEVNELPFQPFPGFTITHSRGARGLPFLPPDLATCPDCGRELLDPKNRRYRHPFITCIHCGPRYTVMEALPYDRERTVMGRFSLCPDCRAEYTTPADRRCHAQTIACPHCGPQLTMDIETAAQLLRQGEVVAVKGIGGYHLCASAANPPAVAKIRQIKHRGQKPFAVLFRNLEEVRQYCRVSQAEEKLLLSAARPIVLLHSKRPLPTEITCGSDRVGAFLPCNPLQILLLEAISPLVATSANISGAPMCTDDTQVQQFGVPVLGHDRPILTPIDDSVLQVTEGNPAFMRRARGYVPLAVELPFAAKQTTLCLGGDLKATFGYHAGRYVFLSQPFGDLEHPDCLAAYQENIERFAALHGFTTEKVVADLHPGYTARRFYTPDMQVQHHIAHAAAVLAEHQLTEPALCFALDGTGYGTDGQIWGSEVFDFDGGRFTHLGHLPPFTCPPGDSVATDAQLCLSCYLGTQPLVNRAKDAGVPLLQNSSAGRLFDAAAAALGLCDTNTYEGQCAAAVEQAARRASGAYPFDPACTPRELLEEMQCQRADVPALALGLHHWLARWILNQAQAYRRSTVVLSGGCFTNQILTRCTADLLRRNGYTVYTACKVPPGDGALALGQAYVSALEE